MDELSINPSSVVDAENTPEREDARVFDASSEGQRILWDRLTQYKNDLAYSQGKAGGDINEGLTISMNNRDIPVTSRNLTEVAAIHDLTIQELVDEIEGKVVIDIGSGGSQLGEEVARQGKKAQIVSFDISKEAFSDKSSGQRVIGDAEHLPFADATIDEILLTISLPYWARSKDQIDKFLSESMRVLKKGGRMRIAPISGIEGRPSLPKGRDVYRSVYERDPSVLAMLRDLQIYFIDTLHDYSKTNVVTIGEAYRDIPAEFDMDTILSYPPSTAIITK